MLAPRSILSVPGSSLSMIAKGLAAPGDEVFLDLEDSVATGAKTAARALVVDAVATGDWRRKRRVVRVNALDTRWTYRDLIDLMERGEGRLDAIVLSKVHSSDDVIAVSRLLDQIEMAVSHPVTVRIGVQIESASGLVNCEAIAAASSRVESLIFGPGDFASSVGMPAAGIGVQDQWDEDYGSHRWHYAMSRILVAARAAGVWAIDGPFADFRDDEGLRRSAFMARALGYDGKWAIHPAQIAAIEDVFSPTPLEIDRANAVVEAMERAEREGAGAVGLDGQMLDAASVAMAKATLARARSANSGSTESF